MDADTTILTFAELAKRAGITIGGAKNLVRRKRWTRHAGNDGATRISVPTDYLAEAGARTDADAQTGTSTSTEAPSALAIIERLSQHIEHLQRENVTLASMPAQVAALRATLEAVRDERDRLLTREHLREQRRFWRRLVGAA
jgi:hypothetical protein